MKTKTIILGSGIGGLAAGAALKTRGDKDFMIFDRCESLPLNLHNGVHYLHNSDLKTPFPFELKKIASTEEVWNPRKDEWKQRSNIPEMIEYSLKVNNTRHPSSIMDPGNRKWDTYIPMSNNMNDLIQAYHDYIGKEHFKFGSLLIQINTEIKIARFVPNNGKAFEVQYERIISTIPANVLFTITKKETELEFKSQPISITNYKTTNIVPNWLISIYISDTQFPPYRITVLNNTISMESIKELTVPEEHVIKYHVDRYFDYELSTKAEYTWTTGRIFGINKYEREEIVKEYMKDDIYLLGRFGLWNGKTLMDSTVKQAQDITWLFNRTCSDSECETNLIKKLSE